jgi:hypothetical protein
MYCAGLAEMRMLDLIKDVRAEHRLDPLELSRSLDGPAEHTSREMASQGFLQHKSPEGVTSREFVRAHGYEHKTAVGETIVAGQESAAETFAQWRDSPPHRGLTLDDELKAIGVARAYDVESEYDWYWPAESGGVLSELAQPCDADAPGTPAPLPAISGATPVHSTCDGAQLPNGTHDLT